MSHGSDSHPPWCATDCAATITGVHTSQPVPVAPTGAELVGITVAVEQLVESPTITAVVLEFVQDDEPAQYRLRVGQARALHRALHRALRGALRRLASG
ncbi:hypothetical protein [Actinophytocola sp.]|uniref:hypothetical protein n=1 Tax=Actinophytocola sp. TaxID=1872138 RepID=UPI002D7FAAB8|nr:hypothetical protein [Actinophytocola sp.]HET9139396.1 hypothetical protein [Actinophytocola sp.]HEU5111302.1 hypothetical protein [Micromonosporaceae bacterium]